MKIIKRNKNDVLKDVRRMIYLYYTMRNENLSALYSITSIEIKLKKNDLTVFIYTYRPGLLIGNGGADVQKLHKHLSDSLGYDRIYVNIEPSGLWNFD